MTHRADLQVTTEPIKNRRILAAGAGRMGRGIAHMFAYAGYPVTLLDLKERDGKEFSQLVDAALAEVEANLVFLSGLGHISRSQVKQVLELIQVRPLASAASELTAADIVIEGVPETREAKQNALGLVGEHVRPDTIVTSTTSSMLVTELQQWVKRPDHFLNTHFLNPAYPYPAGGGQPLPGYR